MTASNPSEVASTTEKKVGQQARARSSAEPMRLRWQTYRRTFLRDDVLASFIVVVLLVPQSLAYAMIAGLPPMVGVAASLLPVLVYAALGSSSSLAVGPVAVVAMMTGQVVVPLATQHGVTPHDVALVLALEIGIIVMASAALRLDALAALLSAPVLHGFVTGASIAIVITQCVPLLGWKLDASSPHAMVQSMVGTDAPWWHALKPHTLTAIIGIGAIVGLVVLRRYTAAMALRLRASTTSATLLQRASPIVVVLASLVVVRWMLPTDAGVSLVGPIDLSSLWRVPRVWETPASLWLALLPSAGAIGLVAYVEGLAVAEALASKRGERVTPLREMVGLGAANAVAGMSGGMPVSGSFSRSVVNFDAGARTRMAGVWTVLVLLIVVALAAPVLQWLPKTVLAATILVAVVSFIDIKPFRLARRDAPAEWVVMMLVTAITVVVGVEQALLVGVVASIAWMLKRTARPHWAEVGRMPGTDAFRNVKRYAVETQDHVLAVRIDEALVFTNTRWLSDTVNELVASRPSVTHVVLMMSGVNQVDFTGLEGLKSLALDLSRKHVTLHLSEVKGPIHDQLVKAELGSWLTGRVFMSQHEADLALRAAGGRAAAAQDPR